MRIIITITAILFSFCASEAQIVWSSAGGGGSISKAKKEGKSFLNTSIKDATWKRDIEDCFVIPYDSDINPGDTIESYGYK